MLTVVGAEGWLITLTLVYYDPLVSYIIFQCRKQCGLSQTVDGLVYAREMVRVAYSNGVHARAVKVETA